MNKLEIKSENNITKIYIDEKEIKGIREYKLKHKKQKAPVILLKMVLSEYDIELDNVCIKKEPFFKKIAHKIYSRFL